MASFTPRTAAFYLAALIDGEGTVTDPGRARSKHVVRITNTDYSIIQAAVACCTLLKVVCQVYERSPKRSPHKRCWDVQVTGRANLERLARLPLVCLRKATRLQRIITSYHRPPRPRPGTLRRLFVVESLTVQQLAICYGVQPQTIKRWLRAQGIVPRSTE
jgi:hypothetical protein